MSGLKHSKDKETRTLYEAFLDFLKADDLSDVLAASKKLDQVTIARSGKPIVKIGLGLRHIAKGVGYLMAPIPTPGEDIVGLKLIRGGVFTIVYAFADLISGLT